MLSSNQVSIQTPRRTPRGFDAGTAAEQSSGNELRGGLAPWQVRKLKLFIPTRLSFPITCAELAQTVRLSPSHFCRAFRVSLQETPHTYVLRIRIERACAQIRATPVITLSQIAADCGFSDQPHFNRVFRRLLGLSPGRWRRLQAAPASPDAPPACPM
jgi:AraC family transcriptional regulator